MTNKDIIRGLYESFVSGDVASVVATFADNISWTEADGFPLAGTYIGPQADVEKIRASTAFLNEYIDNLSRIGLLIDFTERRQAHLTELKSALSARVDDAVNTELPN